MQEKTIKSYQEPGIRIQLVQRSDDRQTWYEVRTNRRIIYSSYRLDHIIVNFRSELYKYTNQLEMAL